jgi:hypothetical protein
MTQDNRRKVFQKEEMVRSMILGLRMLVEVSLWLTVVKGKQGKMEKYRWTG